MLTSATAHARIALKRKGVRSRLTLCPIITAKVARVATCASRRSKAKRRIVGAASAVRAHDRFSSPCPSDGSSDGEGR